MLEGDPPPNSCLFAGRLAGGVDLTGLTVPAVNPLWRLRSVRHTHLAHHAIDADASGGVPIEVLATRCGSTCLTDLLACTLCTSSIFPPYEFARIIIVPTSCQEQDCSDARKQLVHLGSLPLCSSLSFNLRLLSFGQEVLTNSLPKSDSRTTSHER